MSLTRYDQISISTSIREYSPLPLHCTPWQGLSHEARHPLLEDGQELLLHPEHQGARGLEVRRHLQLGPQVGDRLGHQVCHTPGEGLQGGETGVLEEVVLLEVEDEVVKLLLAGTAAEVLPAGVEEDTDQPHSHHVLGGNEAGQEGPQSLVGGHQGERGGGGAVWTPPCPPSILAKR